VTILQCQIVEGQGGSISLKSNHICLKEGIDPTTAKMLKIGLLHSFPEKKSFQNERSYESSVEQVKRQ